MFGLGFGSGPGCAKRMRLRAGVRRNFQERIPGGNTYGFRVPETAISNTSNILEDTFLLATVPEPADATWPLEKGFRPGTIVLRALGPVVASD